MSNADLTARKINPRFAALVCAGLLLPVLAAVHFLAFWLRFDGSFLPRDWELMKVSVCLAALAKWPVFCWFRVHRSWNRYLNFHDLVTLLQAATVGSLVVALIDYMLLTDISIPRSVFLLDWGGTIVVLGGLRAASRLVQEHGRLAFFRPAGTPVFIVGANEPGETLLRAIRRNPRLEYQVMGFISEQDRKSPHRIDGVPVLGTLAHTCDLAADYGVSLVLITAGELSGKQVRQLVEDGQRHGVAVQVLPSFEQLINGRLAVQPRDVSIEDLLHRDPIQLDNAALHGWIDGRVLLVTGSAGSIGSEICRQLCQLRPSKLVLVDRSENGQFFLDRQLRELAPHIAMEVCVADITDAQRIDAIFAQHRPEIVFHAAAYKHVPLMEANPGEAIKNIVLATRQLADIAERHAVASFVMISTDKAVNPTSVMGACKRVAELYVQSLNQTSTCQFETVRFGNVLDSAGSVVPIFREQIRRGGPVTVTHPDMVRYFMTIPEASQLVIQAGAMGQGGEIFVLDMGDPVRIVDLASDMIRLSGLRIDDDIEIEFCGLRPGEKLFEELYLDSERHQRTAHPKIFVANCQRRLLAEVRRAIDALADVADGTSDEVLDSLLRVLPEYQDRRAKILTLPEPATPATVNGITSAARRAA